MGERSQVRVQPFLAGDTDRRQRSRSVQTYGINTGVTDPVNFGMPTIDISGFNQLGGNSGWPLLTTPNQTYQFVDNISYIRGNHASVSAAKSVTAQRTICATVAARGACGLRVTGLSTAARRSKIFLRALRLAATYSW